jgi:hypothetical protein
MVEHGGTFYILSNHCHWVELCCCTAETHPIVIEIDILKRARRPAAAGRYHVKLSA